jgi:hypothetical protein
MKAYNCPNCGAALPARALKLDLAECEFCGTTFRISKTLTPEPEMGDLMLGADFGHKVMPGWEVFNEPERLTFHHGDPAEMHGTYEPSYNSYYVLKSSGFLDDFDASINMKFTEGVTDIIRAGFYLRFTPDGGVYAVLVSTLGSYTIGYYVKGEKGELVWEDLLAWSNHTALRPGLHETNRLRVLCDGQKFRVYLNGTLATSFRDEHFKRGKLYVAVVPTEKSNLGIVFSDLQLREVLR